MGKFNADDNCLISENSSNLSAYRLMFCKNTTFRGVTKVPRTFLYLFNFRSKYFKKTTSSPDSAHITYDHKKSTQICQIAPAEKVSATMRAVRGGGCQNRGGSFSAKTTLDQSRLRNRNLAKPARGAASASRD